MKNVARIEEFVVWNDWNWMIRKYVNVFFLFFWLVLFFMENSNNPYKAKRDIVSYGVDVPLLLAETSSLWDSTLHVVFSDRVETYFKHYRSDVLV